jgi:predicted  nucleic acid-binding Zn-ribbon protein
MTTTVPLPTFFCTHLCVVVELESSLAAAFPSEPPSPVFGVPVVMAVTAVLPLAETALDWAAEYSPTPEIWIWPVAVATVPELLPDAVATAAAIAEGDTEAADPVVDEAEEEEETGMADAEAIEAAEAEDEEGEELEVVSAAAAGEFEELGLVLLGDDCLVDEEVLVAAPRLLASRLQRGQ